MDIKYVCVATVVVIFQQVHIYQTDAKIATASIQKPVIHLNCTNDAQIRLGGGMAFLSGTRQQPRPFSQLEEYVVYANCSFKHSCNIHVTLWHGCSFAIIQYWCTRNDTFVRLKTELHETRSKELNLYYDAQQDSQYIGQYTECTILSNSNITAELVDSRGCPFSEFFFNNVLQPLEFSRTLSCFNWYKIWTGYYMYMQNNSQSVHHIKIYTNKPPTSGSLWLRFTGNSSITATCTSGTTTPPPTSSLAATRPHTTNKGHDTTPITETTAVSIGSSSSTTQDITSPIVTVSMFQNKIRFYGTAPQIVTDISTGSSQNQSSFPVGVVVGVVVAVVVLIVVLILVGYFVLRSRRRAEASTKSVKSTVQNGTYDASSTISVAGANLRTGKDKLSLQDRLNESDNAIYSEPHDSTYDRNEGEISINDDYNRIDFKTRKQFSVDPGCGTLAADHGFNGGQDYSHICDVTPSQEDTYSHIPAGHALVTSGHENSFDDTDDTYNHLNASLGNRNHNARPCQDGIYSHIDESKAKKNQPPCQDVDHAYWVLEKQ